MDGSAVGSASHDRARQRAVLDVLRAAAKRHRPLWLTAEADDLAHRAFEKIRARLEAGEELGDPYLRRVAYTVCIDVVRSERAERRRREASGRAAAQANAVRTPEAAATDREVAQHIRGCVSALPQARRRAAVLYLQGHGATEIARLLDEPYKKIENLVYRALAALRTCLRKKGVTP